MGTILISKFAFAKMEPLSPVQLQNDLGSHSHDPPKSKVKGQPQPPKDGEGFCQPYRGEVCKKIIGNRTIYVHSKEAQIAIEAKLQEALPVVQDNP